ncbi:MAG: DinB family protein [Saprospiraceae bacterium]
MQNYIIILSMAFFDSSLQALDGQLETLLTALSAHAEAMLNQPPSPQSWSAIQVLHHLLLSERLSRQYCEEKAQFQPRTAKSRH